jgi:CrcB protein
MFLSVLLIFLGGGLGSLARFGVSMGVKQFSEGVFPWATLISNVLSCLIIGIALSVFAQKMQDNNLKMFVIVGFCGGFSTFSTFSAETVRIFRDGNTLLGIANVLVSVVMCLVILFFLIPDEKKLIP